VILLRRHMQKNAGQSWKLRLMIGGESRSWRASEKAGSL